MLRAFARNVMICLAGFSHRIDMHDRRRKKIELEPQLLLDLLRDLVPLGNAEVRIDRNRDLGPHPMPDPPRPCVVYPRNPRHVAGRMFQPIDYASIHNVNRAAQNRLP